jgi:hypothetical protein
MIEGGGGPSFALKSLQSFIIGDSSLGQEFESDEATELGVHRLINHTHSAAAQSLDNPVVTNGLA